MSKQRKQRTEGQGGAVEPASGGNDGKPAVWLRWLLSFVLAWHVFVVFIWPFALTPASGFVIGIAQSSWVRWYSDSLYLNHGYGFFGPNPPLTNLVSYTVTDDAGQLVAEGQFPNKEQQRPRLFYHRHMMLADQAGNSPPDVPSETWLDLALRGYGRHLLRVHEGDRVRLDYVRHALLYPPQVLGDVDPNAPDMFSPITSVEVTAADLETPLPVPPLPEPPADESVAAEQAANGQLPAGGGR